MSTAKNKIFHYAKVGIGTESPQKQLQILGDSDTCLRITSSSNGAASLQLGDVDDTVKGAITFLNSDNSLRIRGHNNDDRIVVTSGGKVNIGGDFGASTYGLQVWGSGGTNSATLGIKNNVAGPAGIHLLSGHGNWSIFNSWSIGDALEFRDESAGSTRMIITSSGRVGINTTTDSMDGVTGNLNIANTNFNNHTVINLSRNTTADRPQIRLQNPNGNIGYVGTFGSDLVISSGNDLILRASNTEKVRIDSNGLMGLGVTPTSHNNTTAFQIYDDYNSVGYPRIRLTNQSSGTASSDGYEIVLNGSDLDAVHRQRENADIYFMTNNLERLRINSSGMVVFKGGSGNVDQVKIESQGGGTGLYIANFQGVDAGDASSRLGVGKNDNALIFTNASGTQISNFAIGNTDNIPLILSTNNTRRIHIRGDGRIIMGTGIPTYTNSIVHVEGSGINVEAEYTLEDSTGASPQFSIFGSNSHVRIDMGTLDVSPYAGYIQARFDNDPEQSGTSAAGREPLLLNPRGGTLAYNCHDGNATSIGGGNNSTQGGVVIRAGKAANPTVNNNSTAIKIFPGEVRAYSGTGAYGEQNQGTKYGGIAWNILDPHNGSWGASYGGHHCWMGMSLHSVPGQEFSNWQVQMNSNSAGGSFATNVAIQASPQGWVTKPSQPSFYVRRSTGGDNRPAANPVTEWANPGTSESSGNPVHNRGGHFNYSTGKFTAPINGIYHFDAAAGYKQSGYDFNQKLYINGGAAAEGCRFIDGGDDLVSHSTGTMSLTCYLHKGDEVHIELGYVHHVNGTFNYFSGYLVQ